MAEEHEREAFRIMDRLQEMEEMVRERKETALLDRLQAVKSAAGSDLLRIAVCGHTSSGKSSLINRLCGCRFLPVSPVPSTLNVVRIDNGEERAAVVRRTAGREVTEDISFEQIGMYSEQESDIEAVEAMLPLPEFLNRILLLDMPGMDTAETYLSGPRESALWTADLVFYVMDYNHVQSNMNFRFVKQLEQRGKPVYLIVNQIDKHREKELSFSAFRDSVKNAFGEWDLEPAGVLFVSVKNESPHSQWSALEKLTADLGKRRASIHEHTMEQALHSIMSEHLSYLEDSCNEKIEQLKRSASPDEFEAGSVDQILQTIREKQLRVKELEQDAKEAALRCKEQVQTVLDNANITPATVRDKAHEYLQSRKPGFRTGLFFQKSKTAREQEHRLAFFVDDLNEQVKAQAVWHVRDVLMNTVSDWHIENPERIEQLQHFAYTAGSDWVKAQVMENSVYTNEYTLNFMKQLAERIRTQIRQQANALIEKMELAYQAVLKSRISILKEEIQGLEQSTTSLSEILQLEQQKTNAIQDACRRVPTGLKQEEPELPKPAELKPAPDSTASMDAGASGLGDRQLSDDCSGERIDRDNTEINRQVELRPNYKQRMHAASERLQKASTIIEAFSSMRSLAQSMREKADRLKQNRFVVALFGAFSAGKSSFANAWIGEEVLPVSPNPMTAAINKISPPSEEWPHGSVRVTMKSRVRMEDDVLYSLRMINQGAESLEQALTVIRKLDARKVSEQGKAHISFLKAVQLGWEANAEKLGTVFAADEHQFKEYVSREQDSCYVDDIELFYASPLSDQGITIVDTPGEDSIHARHTGVAFQYLKRADAILFVNYFNHSFSQADRQFLQQLGRIKDSFASDKMFFILNAVDLAGGTEEVDAVMTHLESHLLKHEIRNPRIYPVSSHLSLQAKETADPELMHQSGIGDFEADFYRFCYEQLAELAIRSGQDEMERAVSVLERWMNSAKQDESGRQRKKEELVRAKQDLSRKLQLTHYAQRYEQELIKTIQELFYYVKQRLMFRFHDLYTAALNPSMLREDSGLSKRDLLAGAWNELQKSLIYDLSQDVLATGLRIENAVHQWEEVVWEEAQSAIQEQFAEYIFRSLPTDSLSTPDADETLPESSMDAKWLSGYYKNGKQFFEGGGSANLREDMRDKVEPVVARYVDMHAERFTESYTMQWQETIDRLQQQGLRHGEEYIDGLLEAVSQTVDIGDLQQKQREIQRLISEGNS